MHGYSTFNTRRKDRWKFVIGGLMAKIRGPSIIVIVIEKFSLVVTGYCVERYLISHKDTDFFV